MNVQKSYCTIPSVGVGGGYVDRMFKFYVKVFLCDGQGTVRQAILYPEAGLVQLRIFKSSCSRTLAPACGALVHIVGIQSSCSVIGLISPLTMGSG